MKTKNFKLITGIFFSVVILLVLASFASAYDCSTAPAGCSVNGNNLICDLNGSAERVTVDNFATNAHTNLNNSPLIYTYKNNYGKGSILYKINNLIDTGANNIFLSLFFERTWIDNGSYFPGNSDKDVLQVGKLLGNWNQNTVTWNTKPSFDNIYSETTISQSQASLACSKGGVACTAQAGEYVNFDISDLYKDWVSGANNYGLYISSKYGDYANPSGLAEASGNFFNKQAKIIYKNICFPPVPPTCTDADADSYSIEGGVCGDVDCDDNNDLIHPNAVEFCNGVDDNCNGLIDEGCVVPPLCTDVDVDGYAIEGGVCGLIDCDDNNALVHPTANEVCNGIDDDCNGLIDDIPGCVFPPVCTDNSIETQNCGLNIGECVFGTQTRVCSAGQWLAWSVCSGGINPITEICKDGKDNDCDGLTDEGCGNGGGGGGGSKTKIACGDKLTINSLPLIETEGEGKTIIALSNGKPADGKIKVSISNYWLIFLIIFGLLILILFIVVLFAALRS